MAVRLLTNSTDNTGSAGTPWNGGLGLFLGAGVFGGGTLSMQVSIGGSSWHDASGTSLTADGSKLFELPQGASIRAQVVSGSTSQSVNAWAHGGGN